MIILCSNSTDIHTRLIVQKLTSIYNEYPLILDFHQPSWLDFVQSHYKEDEILFKFSLKNGQAIKIKEVKSIWWRQTGYGIKIDPSIKDNNHRKFVINEWYSALEGFWQSVDCLWINNIQKEKQSSHKSHQLTVARRIGLMIPETLITNNPTAVLEFWKRHPNKIIFKAFSGTLEEWRETRPLRQEFLNVIDNVKLSPVIFQEFIDMASDIRVTVIGEEIFASETQVSQDSYIYDMRMSKTNWKKHILPNYIKEIILMFMKELGLEYGAIDMKLTSKNEYYFLEINPSGAFAFIEKETKLPISETIAKHLVNGTRRNRRLPKNIYDMI